jgi:hypothetical protein
MTKYLGMGWHFQSVRHSKARKYGKAGGTYATSHKRLKTKFPSHTKLILCEYCGKKHVAGNVFTLHRQHACRECYYAHTHDKRGNPIPYMSTKHYGEVEKKKCYVVTQEGYPSRFVWAKSVEEVEEKMGATRNIINIRERRTPKKKEKKEEQPVHKKIKLTSEQEELKMEAYRDLLKAEKLIAEADGIIFHPIQSIEETLGELARIQKDLLNGEYDEEFKD